MNIQIKLENEHHCLALNNKVFMNLAQIIVYIL